MRKMEQGTKALISLRDLIVSGKLPARERLLELELEKRLKISRTPIRSALVKLAEEGLLEKVAGTYTVREFTQQEIRDAIRLRGMVEGMAVRVAAERGTRSAASRAARDCVAELEELLDSWAPDKVDIEAFLDINARFHSSIVEMADSFVITRTLEHVCSLPFASPNAFVIAQRDVGDIWKVFFNAQQHHRSMLEAIDSGEGARAESIAREHAELSLDALRLVIRTQTGIDRIPGMTMMFGSGKRIAADVSDLSMAKKSRKPS